MTVITPGTPLTRAASAKPSRSKLRRRRATAPARVARVGAPGQRPPPTGRKGRRRDRSPHSKGAFARFLMCTMFLGGLVFTGMATTATTAHADLLNIPCSIVPTFYNTGPEPLGAGVEGFMPPDKFYPSTSGSPTAGASPSQLTVFEQFGVRGAMFSGSTQLDAASFFSDDDKKRSCSVSDWGMNLGAQFLFDTDRFITATQIGIRQRASDSGPLLRIMRQMTPSVNTMRDVLFIPGAAIAVIATGIWVLIKYREDQTREVIRGVAWAFLAIVLVGWLISPTKQASSGPTQVKTGSDSNFYWAAAAINDTRDQAVAALASAITSSSGTDDVCSIAAGTPYAGQRLIDCRIYEGLVFQPWAQAMFGPQGAKAIPIIGAGSVQFSGQGHADAKFGPFAITDTKDLRVVLLAAQAFNNDGHFLLNNNNYGAGNPLSPPAQSPTPTTGTTTINKADLFQLYEKVFQQVETGNGKYGSFPAFRGTNASARLSTALGSSIASVMVGIPVVITSLLSMMWNAIPILLFLLLPIVGLFSIYPPMQKHLRGLLQTWAKASILGFGFAIVQLIGALVISILMATPNLALGWKCVTLIILIIAMFRLIKGFQEDQFTPNIGAPGYMDPTESVSRVGQTTRRTAGRVTSGAGRRAGGSVVGGTAGIATAAKRGVSQRVTNRGPSRKKLAVANDRIASRRGNERARVAQGLKDTDQQAPSPELVDKFKQEELGELQTQQGKDQQSAKENRPGRTRRAASSVKTGVTAGAKGAAAGGLAANKFQGALGGVRAGSVDRTGVKGSEERGQQNVSRREAIAKEAQRSNEDAYKRRLEAERAAATNRANREHRGAPRTTNRPDGSQGRPTVSRRSPVTSGDSKPRPKVTSGNSEPRPKVPAGDSAPRPEKDEGSRVSRE